MTERQSYLLGELLATLGALLFVAAGVLLNVGFNPQASETTFPAASFLPARPPAHAAQPGRMGLSHHDDPVGALIGRLEQERKP